MISWTHSCEHLRLYELYISLFPRLYELLSDEFEYLYKKSHVDHKARNNTNHKAQHSICHSGGTDIDINLQKIKNHSGEIR